MGAIAFDTYKFIKRLKEAGVSEKVAEAEALAFKDSVQESFAALREEMKLGEVLTKRDIMDTENRLRLELEKVRAEMERTRNQIILWAIGIATTYSIGLLAVLAKGFHWL